MKNIRKQNKEWSIDIDKKYADLKTNYGSFKVNNKWMSILWQPIAKTVSMIVYDKDNQDNVVKTVEGIKKGSNWIWEFDEDMEGMFYQYKITHQNDEVTLALDPYAKSMAAFDWEGKDTNVGKAAFVSFPETKELFKLNEIDSPQPIIYEAHVRDLTAYRRDVTMPGSFNALKEMDFAKHLKQLGITHIQFLPIHSCFALNEKDKTILEKGQGKGWTTNYNWGYDPHNYFSVNGWFSSDPSKPKIRMQEFKDIVKYFHDNDIKVVLDVVYNHMYVNSIFDNVIPGYYYRDGSDVTPVNLPALSSERLMVRRLIVESLVHFVKTYDVDGFRFDLLTFTDKETIEVLTKELRKIKPNIVLHGEAWDFTDLEKTNSYNKGFVDNGKDFAYFNDTTRDAIKGPDDADEFGLGLIGGNHKLFGDYLASVIGNIKDFKKDVPDISKDSYTRFTDYPNNALNYISCHDGHTMWDKVNLTVKGDLTTKFEYYRQALLMQQLLQGRVLFLEGTELLYTKPADESGQDFERHHETSESIDIFGFDNPKYSENSYRTTDYTNALRWEHLEAENIKELINDFIAKTNMFRQQTKFFNISSSKGINDAYSFNYVSKEQKIIDFNITIDNETIRVIHNLSSDTYEYKSNGDIYLDSKIKETNKIGTSLPNSTILIKERVS